MTFTLHVDGQQWRGHTEAVRDAVRSAVQTPQLRGRGGDIVPVAKGNGYGFGLARLATETTRLGSDRIAVGTAIEAAKILRTFDGDVLVMQPWDPRDVGSQEVWDYLRERHQFQRVILTIASNEALHALAVSDICADGPIRIVVEGLTSMRRFGLGEPDLDALLADAAVREALRSNRIALAGLAVHLPIAAPAAPHIETMQSQWHDSDQAPQLAQGATPKVREAWAWSLTWIRAVAAMEEAGVPLTGDAVALWLSHLTDEELVALRTALPDVPIHLRVGTRLWLGDPGALHATGTVLAVHEISRGQSLGYRQKRSPKSGLVLVVSGGTSHGVALEAPTPAASLRQRMVAAGTGALEAVGRSLSPFTWNGKRRWFAEPPHMHVSMIWIADDDVRQAVGGGHRVPTVGDQLECRVRHTTAAFDRLEGLTS